MRRPEHVLLQGVVGSTAYGMAHAGSDVDRGGIYAADPMDLLDLNNSKPEADSYVQHEPEDIWLHEARKALRLQLGCNPTASEVLWLPEYEIMTEQGQKLIEIRETFLSAKRVRDGYLGFATSQLKRFFGYDKVTEEGRKHSAKNARHLFRLLYQGLEAYKGYGIVVRLPEGVAQTAREFGERAVDESQLVHDMLAAFERDYDMVRSPLPEEPDREPARVWLLELRRSML